MDKRTVHVNIPYLMEIVEQSGMSRAEFSTKVLLRAQNFVSSLIYEGKTSKSTALAIVRATGCDAKKMLQKVDYNPEDYRINPYLRSTEEKKDGTIAQYIALLSDSTVEMAKNQKQVGELMVLVSKAQIENKQRHEEEAKVLQQILVQINAIGKKVDEIHRELH